MGKLSRVLIFVCIGMLLSACQLNLGLPNGLPVNPLNAARATQVSKIPSGLTTPTSTAAPILVTKTFQESSTSPPYTIDLRWPALEWGGDPRVDAFNQAAEAYPTGLKRSFIEGASKIADDPSLKDYSSLLKTDFIMTNGTNGILSILFNSSEYNAGAAHPGHFSYAINYDLSTGQILNLSDLFEPDADYLKALSSFCLADLKARQVLEWDDGALPKAENYQIWNITPNGLKITFDEYMVTSYAMGPQTVMVPYDRLNAILRKNGPLSSYYP